jgi:CRISPR/Cas system-associated exonuclease Cas4 (RecB family)
VDIKKMRAGTGGPHLSEKEKVPACVGCGFARLCPGPRKDYIAVHGHLK